MVKVKRQKSTALWNGLRLMEGVPLQTELKLSYVVKNYNDISTYLNLYAHTWLGHSNSTFLATATIPAISFKVILTLERLYPSEF